MVLLPSSGGCWQVRFTLAILSLLGIVLMYAMRVCLSIAIVGMVGTEQHHHGEHNGSEAVAADDTCPSPEQTSGKPKETIVSVVPGCSFLSLTLYR